MKFNINITTDDGELLNVLTIDTAESRWDSATAKYDLVQDIYNEIARYIKGLKALQVRQ